MSSSTGWQTVARRIRVPMGFVFAAIFLWCARPTWHTMAASLLLVLPGLSLRAYASGYVKKNAELTMTGPYAHTRNPLYLGSILIAFGFALASWSLAIFIALAVLFTVIYIPTIQSEEAFLRSTFPAFEGYVRSVPRIFPRLTPSKIGIGQSAGAFSGGLYLRHREYNSAMGAAAIYLVLAAKLLYHAG